MAAKDEKAAVAKAIAASPTASDAQIAAECGVAREVVTVVRAEIGPKHTWKKEK